MIKILYVQKHHQNSACLISDLLWKVCAVSIILTATFTAVVYYADLGVVEEAIAEFFNLVIEKAENAAWAIKQKSL